MKRGRQPPEVMRARNAIVCRRLAALPRGRSASTPRLTLGDVSAWTMRPSAYWLARCADNPPWKLRKQHKWDILNALRLWDAGLLAKVKIDGRWTLVRVPPSQAKPPVGAAPEPPADDAPQRIVKLKVDFMKATLKVI